MASQKSILLDLGGVVFEYSGRDSDTIDWTIVKELNLTFDKLSLGQDTLENYLGEYNRRTALNLNPREFLENIWDTLTYNEDLITYLRTRYPIYILSDNYRENIAYISKRFHFQDWCRRQFYSFDFEMTKTNPTIFVKVIEELEIPIEDLIFIDDSPEKIASARSVGLQSIQFLNNQQLFDELSTISG